MGTVSGHLKTNSSSLFDLTITQKREMLTYFTGLLPKVGKKKTREKENRERLCLTPPDCLISFTY